MSLCSLAFDREGNAKGRARQRIQAPSATPTPLRRTWSPESLASLDLPASLAKMLASTRCLCLAARAARPTAAVTPTLTYRPTRSLHAFAPTPSRELAPHPFLLLTRAIPAPRRGVANQAKLIVTTFVHCSSLQEARRSTATGCRGFRGGRVRRGRIRRR